MVGGVRHPEVIARTLKARAPGLVWVILATGPLSAFLYHRPFKRGVSVVCMCARHAKGVLSALALASLVVVVCSGCSRPSADSDANSVPIPSSRNLTKTNPNCLTPDQERVARDEPVSNEAAKRLARHFGGCIYDSEKALPWMRLAAERGDREAMLGLAAMLEGGDGPAAAAEVSRLRERAAETGSDVRVEPE